MKFFQNIETLEDLRKEYKRLLKQFHPDNEGSEEFTKEINNEYDILFKEMKNSVRRGSNGQEEKNNEFNEEFDKAFRDIINKVIDLNVNIEIIGSWIWVSGNTYSIRETLKRLNFKWSAKRQCWAWHIEPFTKKSNKSKTMDELRKYYGSSVIKKEESYKVLAATAC